MYGIVLIVVIAVMGGIIAYIGDHLGSKVGKRKLSIFGLRPKHTSIVVTIVTGILIAGATLGVLSLASRDVRTALFGMEALKAQLTSLTGEVAIKNNELSASYAALDAKTAEFATLDSKIKETVAKLSAVANELGVVTLERDRAATALAEAQANYGTEIAALQVTKNELDTRVAALSDAKAGLQSDINRLNELTANLRQGIQIVREGAILYRAGEVLATVSLPGGENRVDTEKALGEFIFRVNHIILERLEVADKNTEALWIAQSDFEQAVTYLAANPGDTIVRISSAGNTIYGEPVIGHIDIFPTNKLVFKGGTPIYSEVFEVGHGDQAEEIVLTFLNKVNATAIRQGILPDPIQGTVGSMSGSELYNAVSKVKRYGGKVELAAVAKGDTYTMGPLKVDIIVRSIIQ